MWLRLAADLCYGDRFMCCLVAVISVVVFVKDCMASWMYGDVVRR